MTARLTLFVLMISCIGFTSCNNKKSTPAEEVAPDLSQTKNPVKMNNLVSIIEIPAMDLKRATKFYESMLAVKIEEVEMGGAKLGIIPNEEGTVNVVLANGSDYKATADGSVIYLNGGENLQTMLDKVEPGGGKVIVPKTEISPEMGYFALFIDTEGNKLGLHSPK